MKWPGGKYRLIDNITRALGAPVNATGSNRLIEPFVGSGAVFLNTRYERYLLGDSNPDLINLFNALRTERELFIEQCASLFIAGNNNAIRYYALRREFNMQPSPSRKAALFLYLNRHGYNGLCRYNSRGEFNTPFGQISKPYFPRTEMLHFIEHGNKVTFKQQDFRRTMLQARRGDSVYCDPPYVPLSRTASFTDYYTDGFDWSQQIRLAETAAHLARRGVHVVISNHETAAICDLYHQHGARLRKLSVRRSISCNGANRSPVSEVIAVFKPVTIASTDSVRKKLQ
ncbi:MAG: Dam family site-specific DNA-(adenine-N6)-methyltransferase [Gammaproteobacteria bacterium]